MDETEILRDADLTVDASTVLFQTWSCIYLCDELADEMLERVEQVCGMKFKFEISTFLDI